MSKPRAHLRAYRVSVVDHKTAKPQLLGMLERAVPIVETGILSTADAEGPLSLPVAQVSVVKRRDIADLPRVHAQEGDGDTVCQWVFPTAQDFHWAFLSVQLVKPARCAFVLCFNMQTQVPLLRSIVKTESLLVSIVPPTAQDVLAQSILIHPSGAELRLMLDALVFVKGKG